MINIFSQTCSRTFPCGLRIVSGTTCGTEHCIMLRRRCCLPRSSTKQAQWDLPHQADHCTRQTRKPMTLDGSADPKPDGRALNIGIYVKVRIVIGRVPPSYAVSCQSIWGGRRCGRACQNHRGIDLSFHSKLVCIWERHSDGRRYVSCMDSSSLDRQHVIDVHRRAL
jgi:hypothetical protein